MKQKTLALLSTMATILAPLPALAGFSCPAATPNAMGEKPALGVDDIAATNGPINDRLKSTIHRMRSAGVKSGEIVDRLVVADCSRIDADKNLSDDDKAARVRRFASKLAKFVYTSPGKSEEEIILDVPVPSQMYERLRQAAKKAGVSEEIWAIDAIVDRLGKP